MTPEKLIDAVYRTYLGRPVEAEALAHWAQREPAEVLAGVLASPEFAARHQAGDGEEAIHEAARRVNRAVHVVDVGAQVLESEDHIYAPLSRYAQLEVVGFDPLQERMTQRAAIEGTAGVTLLPYALGDGEKHTLYVNNDDSTSSLFPLDVEHNARFEHLHTLATTSTVEVETHRLDDVLPPGPVDFLKIDVQGAELMVLRGGPEAVGRAAVVHCEVEFSPIYARQPLYADVERELAGHGFYLVDLLVPHRYHYEGTRLQTADRLLWADAVFFRATADRETRTVQALVAGAVYAKLSLMEHLLA